MTLPTQTTLSRSVISAGLPGVLLPALLLLLAPALCRAQRLRLPDIERRYDAVVLLADVRTGRLLGGCRTAEASERRYHPGSLFKLAIAVAALRSGKFDRSLTYVCRGKDTIAGAERRCWRADGHDTIGFREAIALSCNLYFRHLARELSLQEIAQGARSIGMYGSPEDAQSELNALTDETILGDGFAVSPAGMLDVALALASRGRLAASGASLRGAAFSPLYDGMLWCVASGTGQGAWTPRFTVAGKTGTTEVDGTKRTVGWFIGFAPASEPRYAVVVMERNARGFEAATIARKALEKVM